MKIVIIGRGNAGCISALHFAYHRKSIDTKVEIELRYDSTIPPVPTGQGTTLEFTDILFKNFQLNFLQRFPTTMKTGIMYENFTPKNIFHPFPIGSYALHFEPKSFQDFICSELQVDFKETDENVENYNSVDADYIIDCRGSKNNNPDDYYTLVNPLNCALLATLPKKENDVLYTRSIAHKNGWCFYIPLPDKTSLGYLFNTNITSTEDAISDFKETFNVENINRVFPFQQYVAKNPIIEDRVLLNGNKLFFLEPLEATAMSAYLRFNRFYFDYIFNNANKELVVHNVYKYVQEIQNFILWHYANGSIYKTKFWEHGQHLWKQHRKDDIERIITTVKGMSKEDVSKSISSVFSYGQWEKWNFKLWLDGINNENL